MRVFVGVLDQSAAFFYVDVNAVLAALVGDLESDRVDAAAVAEREMARRLRAGIEMLVKPAPRRAVNAARFPFYLDDVFSMAGFVGSNAQLFRPQQHIAGRLQAQENRAGAVIVRLVVARGWPLRDMTDRTVSRKLELSDPHSRAFHFAVVQMCRLDVHAEIGFQDMLHARLVALLADVEITVGAGVALGKYVGTIKYKLLAVDGIHHQRRICHAEELHRLTPAVNQAMRGIERRRE